MLIEKRDSANAEAPTSNIGATNFDFIFLLTSAFVHARRLPNVNSTKWKG